MQAILSSSTTRKNKRKKKKVCVTVLVVGVGVDRGRYCGVCVRGGCVTEDVWMNECDVEHSLDHCTLDT